ncbi:erythrocyte membrane protein 1 (PfEMP1), exon, putative [Plasmodium sp. DRC-Itaito]|nr:erythrocyte membrane protein 1 (PfEMP1), exon, putative [Plasmodium sp. DRC-Itaito]
MVDTKGKTYIYVEGDKDEDMFMSDTTEITSSESEVEELDINDIYKPCNPKYKTLIQKKSFIRSIHDRDLLGYNEITYNILDNHIPISCDNNVYSGKDLINDSLSGKPIDIYDELLKRKENELYGTKYTKKNTYDEPIIRLYKLKELWDTENNSGENSCNKIFNTDISIEINMDRKPINEFTNIDTYTDNPSMDIILEKVENDIYYDIDDIYVDNNNMDIVEMNANNKKELFQEEYPISDVWNM